MVYQKRINNLKTKDMTTIAKKGDFKVIFNGSNTYFVMDNNDDIWYRVSNEKVAMNKLNKIA